MPSKQSDHEASAKAVEEEFIALAVATQVLHSETCGGCIHCLRRVQLLFRRQRQFLGVSKE